jgi:DNA-binding MarR family transcriptional regulator
MSSNTHLEQSYLALVEFLLLSKRQIVEIGQEHNLTAMQAMTLFLLDRPRPMRDFITIFNCDPSNVTGIVDGLEQKQLAERGENPTDRRIKMIELKPEGTKIRTALVHQLVGPKSYILGNLTPDEVDQFIALTQKITRQS